MPDSYRTIAGQLVVAYSQGTTLHVPAHFHVACVGQNDTNKRYANPIIELKTQVQAVQASQIVVPKIDKKMLNQCNFRYHSTLSMRQLVCQTVAAGQLVVGKGRARNAARYLLVGGWVRRRVRGV